MGFSPTRACIVLCVGTVCVCACVFEAHRYRAAESEQSNSRGKRVKQLASIERKLTAHLILSARLLNKRLWKEEKPLKRCQLRKAPLKTKTRKRAPMKGRGCKFSTELSVHYRVIRDEARSHKGAPVL